MGMAPALLFTPLQNSGMSRGEHMATDPVCYTVVEEDEARYTSMYKGQEYCFCSGFCKKKFDENPGMYAKIARSIDIGSDLSC